MAIDNRIGNKVQKNFRREEAPATRVDPHPYIGVVKNNLDPARSGRLQVWIPDLGGNQDEPKNWRTVSYSSPYMGSTDIAKVGSQNANTDNKWGNTPHTYGMWMVPPDIGVEVLVVFVGGDPLRGYWIGCVNSNISRYMLPAMAGSTNFTVAGSDVDSSVGGPVPVTEFNENDPGFDQSPAFYNNTKPIHQQQYHILREQGLDRDTVRGVITSSSQRESPSQVFGISTPGRPYPDNGADDPEGFLAKVQAGTLTEADYAYTTRQGGHSFVMDDGDITGNDQLFRLRTGKGHQIMMNDSNNTLYINHADGGSWIELANDGSISVYSQSGFNLRTQGTLNLHADKDININAGGKLSFNSSSMESIGGSALFTHGSLTLQATGATNIKTGSMTVDASAKISVNAGGLLTLDGDSYATQSFLSDTLDYVPSMNTNNLSDTKGGNGAIWTSQPNLLKSIVTVAPTHEPFNRGESAFVSAPSSGVQAQSKYSGNYDATKNTGNGVGTKATLQQIRDQLKVQCTCTIGNLTREQLVSLFAEIALGESGFNYSPDQSKNPNYAGKYQFGREALQTMGYVKKSLKQNAGIHDNINWVGKNGINSLSDWLNNGPEQESAMCGLVQINYNAMLANGAITADMSADEVAGMLYVAHLLGAGGAHAWRLSGAGHDANGTTGDMVFNRGKYAIAVLSPQVDAVDKG